MCQGVEYPCERAAALRDDAWLVDRAHSAASSQSSSAFADSNYYVYEHKRGQYISCSIALVFKLFLQVARLCTRADSRT